MVAKTSSRRRLSLSTVEATVDASTLRSESKFTILYVSFNTKEFIYASSLTSDTDGVKNLKAIESYITKQMVKGIGVIPEQVAGSLQHYKFERFRVIPQRNNTMTSEVRHFYVGVSPLTIEENPNFLIHMNKPLLGLAGETVTGGVSLDLERLSTGISFTKEGMVDERTTAVNYRFKIASGVFVVSYKLPYLLEEADTQKRLRADLKKAFREGVWWGKEGKKIEITEIVDTLREDLNRQLNVESELHYVRMLNRNTDYIK